MAEIHILLVSKWGISGAFAYSVLLMSKTLLIFIADIEPSCFETIDHSVHHDLRNADLQSSFALSSSLCKVPLIQQLFILPTLCVSLF